MTKKTGTSLAVTSAMKNASVAVRSKFSEDEWRGYVAVALKQTATSILEAGRRMCQFRAEVYDESAEGFTTAASKLWGISATESVMWAKIGTCADYLEPYTEKLPASYRTIYELVVIAEEQVKKAIEDGTITSSMTQLDAKAWKKEVKNPGAAQKEEREKEEKKEERKEEQRTAVREQDEAQAEKKQKKQEREQEKDYAPSDKIESFMDCTILEPIDALGVLGICIHNPRLETVQAVHDFYRDKYAGDSDMESLLWRVRGILGLEMNTPKDSS